MSYRRLSRDDLESIRHTARWGELITTLGGRLDGRDRPSGELFAFCPFHEETMPSFHHTPGKGWYCHSCKKNGRLFDLVQQARGGTIWEAARWLLDQGLASLGPAAGSRRRRRAASPAAQSPLPLDAGPPPAVPDLRRFLRAHSELERRGLSEATRKTLGFGYLPKGHPKITGRLVFQVRDLTGDPPAVRILTHTGRALSAAQAEQHGKWTFFSGFRASQYLYNRDLLWLDARYREDLREHRTLILCEGPFDVAKLHEAGIYRAVATFGNHLTEAQLGLVGAAVRELPVERIVVFFDRDQDGSDVNREGAQRTLQQLSAAGLEASSFDWGQVRSDAADPCELSVAELQGLSWAGRL